MARRHTALWASFFVVIAVGTYGSLTVIDQPKPSINDPAHTLSSGEQFDVNGRTYEVASIDATVRDGELIRSGELSWVNDSAIYSKNFANNSTLTIDGIEYRVSIPNSSDPARATLQEVQRSNSTNERTSRELREGDTVQFQNNSTIVADVSADSLVVQWRGPKTMSKSLGETTAIKTTLVRGGSPEQMQFPAGGSNVTLNGEAYTVHYPDNSTVQLSTDRKGYQHQLRQVRHRTERIAGLWGVFILSTLTTVLLVGLSYLPTKH